MEGFFVMKEDNPGLEQVLMASAPGENYDKGMAKKMLSSSTLNLERSFNLFLQNVDTMLLA